MKFYYVVFSLFIGSISIKTTIAIPLWKTVCAIYGWKALCNNFFQAQTIGVAANMKGNVISAADCMLIGEKGECRISKSRDGHPCSWCELAPRWKNKFGDGACMTQSISSVACASIGEVLFEPMLASGISLPRGQQQAECLIYSSSETECESLVHSGHQCSYCTLPNVYGMKPVSALCLHPEVVAVGACAMLQNVPHAVLNSTGN